MNRIVIIILVTLLFLMVTGGWGATYYVSPTGSDATGDGSESNPWRTISKAVQEASAGDVIKVMDDDNDATDDYVENIVVDKQLTIEAYDNDGTLPTIKSASGDTNPIFKLTADGSVIRNFRAYGTAVNGGSAVWINDANNCEVSGIVTGWSSDKRACFGVYIGYTIGDKNQNNYIHDCTFKYNYADGVRLNGAKNNRISNLTIENCNGGIYLDAATNNSISQNTIKNCLKGIYMLGSSYNEASGNTIEDCKWGVYLEGVKNNVISNNTIQTSQKHGIYIHEFSSQSTPQSTMIVGNSLIQNSFAGLLLRPTDIRNSVIVGNIFLSNKYGICDSSSTGNRDVYLNEFLLSTTDNVWGFDQYFYSPTKLSYLFKHVTAFKMVMGNYYESFFVATPTGNDDPDMVGVAKNFKYDNSSNAKYPLVKPTDEYYLYVWYLGNPVMRRGNFTGEFKQISLPANNGSQVWTADEAAINDVYFPAGSTTDTTSWTGLLTFKTAPASGDAFDILVGYADDASGTNFTQGGPTATITGDGSSERFTFTCSANAFTVPQGKYLAVKIVNKSSTDYNLLVGAVWSYISAPAGSQRYPRNTPPALDVMYVSPNGSDATGMGTVNAPLRSFRPAIEIISSGKTIKVMDDNQSGTIDYEENMTVNKTLTIEPYLNDNTPPEIEGYASEKDGFSVTANNTVIRNMKITYCNYGIHYEGVTGGTISGNILNYHELSGIDVTNCSNLTISNNTCKYNDSQGIHLYNCTNSTITGNECRLNDSKGILVNNNSNGNTISNNNCSDNDYSGIDIPDSDENIVSGNTCNGNNYYGIALWRGDKTFFYNNTCNNNDYYGIYIFRGDWNVISHNTLLGNKQRGINIYGYTFDYSENNLVVYNNIGSSPYGLYSSSNVDKNEAFGNTIHDNTTAGIYVTENSFRAYFNDLTNNAKTIEDNGTLSAVSERKMGYIYDSNTKTMKEYLGNYYSDYTGNDANGDGIGDTPYAGSGFNDGYPLKQSITKYNLQTWFIHQGNQIKRDVLEGYGLLTVDGTGSKGNTVILVDPQPAQTDIDFGVGDQNANTSWTGLIRLNSNNEYNFTIQMGYADADGSNFTPSGASDNPSGIGDQFYFATTASSFTVPKGKHLAVRVTNNLSGSKEIITGGYSYISAPVQSEDYSLPVLLASFVARETEEGVLLEWVTESEIQNAGFHIYRATRAQGPFYRITSALIPGGGNSSHPRHYRFVDRNVVIDSTYWYKLQDVDINGHTAFHPAISITITRKQNGGDLLTVPTHFYLNPNFPNPFNQSTLIRFGVPEQSQVSLKIYDIQGRLVKILYDGEMAAGHYRTHWNGENQSGNPVASGIYLLRLDAPYFSRTYRMLLVR